MKIARVCVRVCTVMSVNSEGPLRLLLSSLTTLEETGDNQQHIKRQEVSSLGFLHLFFFSAQQRCD